MFKSCYIIPLKLKLEQILASNKAALTNLEYLIFINDSHLNLVRVRTKLMMFNIPFNNISVISWWSVLLVVETSVSRENNQPAKSH